MKAELFRPRLGTEYVDAPLVMDICREWLTIDDPTPRAIEARLLELLASPKYAADPVRALCAAIVAACELWITASAELMELEGDWNV